MRPEPPAADAAALVPGRVLVGRPGEIPRAAARSHLCDGRCVGLLGATGSWALDAELDRRPPQALVRRFGAHRFWERWTRAECAAKLADVPIVLWLRHQGLAEPDPAQYFLATLHLEGGALVVSAGRRAGDDAATVAPSRSQDFGAR